MQAKGYIVVLLLGISVQLSAQDTVYIDKKYRWVDKSEAVEYGVITKSGKTTEVAFYTLDGRHKGTGQYARYTADPAKRVRNGKSVYLYPDGKDSLTIDYVKNKREGRSVSYYPGGKVHEVWLMKNNRAEKLTAYYRNGALRREETFGEKPFESKGGVLYDEHGKQLEFTPYRVAPVFPGGLEAFADSLRKVMVYPRGAAARREEGKVYIDFVIAKDGRLENPRVRLSSGDAGMENASLNAFLKVAETYRCTPGMEDGRPVRVKYTFPITFRMQ